MEDDIKIEHGYGVRRMVESKHLVFLMWIVLSLVFTLYSKWLMSMYFPYPITMSLVHMLAASVLSHVFGGVVSRKFGGKSGTSATGGLSSQEKKGILVFSIVVAINIWFSNASLHLVSISLHQMARTTIPLFTMVLGVLFFKHKYRLAQIPPVVLVIVGVAVTVKGTPELSLYGLLIVFMGCCVSSLKGILAQKLQVENLKINPIVMLQYVGPVASLTLGFFSVVFGEMHRISRHGENMNRVVLLMTSVFLVFSGILAFVLNVLSFMSSSVVTPLAMNIAGNVKQLLTCLLGCIIFGSLVTDKLILGILLTSLGALWYSLGKQRESGRRKVRYVKGRYIDRVGLGIPSDEANGAARLHQSRCPASEIIEIRQVEAHSKSPAAKHVEESEDLSEKSVSLELGSLETRSGTHLQEEGASFKAGGSGYLKMESITEEEEYKEIPVDLEVVDEARETGEEDDISKKGADARTNISIMVLESGAKISQAPDENANYSNLRG